MIGISFAGSANKLGDKIIFTSLPENYFLSTGNKLVDVDKNFLFDYNPYVLRDEPTDTRFNLWYKIQGQKPAQTIAKQICNAFQINCVLNSPRLYRFENIKKLNKSVVIHTTGNTIGAIPLHISNYIREKYSKLDFQFIRQIGCKEDVNIGCVDYRGIGFWESTEIIAESEIFIGVDSSMMHVAAAYPSTRMKIIIVNKTNDEVENFIPCSHIPHYGWYGWIYHNCEYFNCTEHDIGITRSYLKI